jgi:hypothetical protein
VLSKDKEAPLALSRLIARLPASFDGIDGGSENESAVTSLKRLTQTGPGNSIRGKETNDMPRTSYSYFPLDGSSVSRRRLLKRSLQFAGLFLVGSALYPPGRSMGLDVDPEDDDWLRGFAENVARGGPPRDGIPPVDEPRYEAAEDADRWLHEDDVVFGLDYNGEVKAYPQLVLVWHEIVNDTVGGEPVSVTYCPLTGSAVGFRGRVPGASEILDFGTSGNLVNSNLLMYDRPTDSFWPQVLGIAIEGPSKGHVLEEFPVVWTSWGRWKAKYPRTEVLSRDTGFLRSYGNDPYGSYRSPNGYYHAGEPFFPVMTSDDLFPAKEVVMGVKLGNARLAIHKASARAERVVNLSLADAPLVSLYDDTLDTVRVYRSDPDGQGLRFEWVEGKVRDSDTGSAWTPTGRAETGSLEGTQLEYVNSWDVMWFSWYAFHPETEVYGG